MTHEKAMSEADLRRICAHHLDPRIIQPDRNVCALACAYLSLLDERDELLKMIDAADRVVFERDLKKDPGGYGP